MQLSDLKAKQAKQKRFLDKGAGRSLDRFVYLFHIYLLHRRFRLGLFVGLPDSKTVELTDEF